MAGLHRSKRAVLKLVAHSLTPVKQKKKGGAGKEGRIYWMVPWLTNEYWESVL